MQLITGTTLLSLLTYGTACLLFHRCCDTLSFTQYVFAAHFITLYLDPCPQLMLEAIILDMASTTSHNDTMKVMKRAFEEANKT